MKPIHWLTLVILATISGSSFLFTKSLSAEIGPIFTTVLRIFLAGLALVIYAGIVHSDMEWKKNWKRYGLIGLMNSGAPFLLYSYASLAMPASYMAIVNSTAPIFGAIFSFIWLAEKVNVAKVIGLLGGVLGVGTITYSGFHGNLPESFLYGVMACVVAAASYAISGIYIKKFAKDIKPLALAGGSQLAAGIIMAPFCYMDYSIFSEATLSLAVVAKTLALSLVCSAIAFILYFRLIIAVGPTKTLTVTFLSPFVAMVLGAIVFGEQITTYMLAGSVVIIVSTMLINGLIKPGATSLAQPSTGK